MTENWRHLTYPNVAVILSSKPAQRAPVTGSDFCWARLVPVSANGKKFKFHNIAQFPSRLNAQFENFNSFDNSVESRTFVGSKCKPFCHGRTKSVQCFQVAEAQTKRLRLVPTFARPFSSSFFVRLIRHCLRALLFFLFLYPRLMR